MNIIQYTYELPPGLYRMYQVRDEAEAKRIAFSGQHLAVSYLYRSRVIAAVYLFVRVTS